MDVGGWGMDVGGWGLEVGGWSLVTSHPDGGLAGGSLSTSHGSHGEDGPIQKQNTHPIPWSSHLRNMP